MSDNKQFSLLPIGKLYQENKQVILQVDTTYRKGLLHISKFSHVIIIYQNDTEANILHTPLCQKAVRLLDANEKDGTLLLNGIHVENQRYIIYDIKPYFPMEDRVKEAIVPSLPQSIPSSMYQSSLSKLGNIQTFEGDYYLDIPHNFEAYANVLQGYSHIKVIWWFHKFEKDTYKKTMQCDPPYENAPRTGIFASRSPVRPNPIAMTTARIIHIDKKHHRIKVSLLDCYNDTPLIGIYPYRPEVDDIADVKLPDWLAHWLPYVDDREFSSSTNVQLQKSASDVLQVYTIKQDTSITNTYFKTEEVEHPYQQDGIVVKGARQNNLKNIDVHIPYGTITVLTGVSGSGKSSLAFDTIFAESQQRFLSSMSMNDCSHFTLLEKPDFDYITGLPPAISIAQQNVNRNPRSTVGTSTDLYQLLRTLYSTIGIRHCPSCGKAIVKETPEDIISQLQACKPGTRLSIKAMHDTNDFNEICILDKDDINYKQSCMKLENMVQTALKQGNGAMQVQLQNDILSFQTTEKCYDCEHIFFELTPSDFSFNNPESMCPICHGLGTILEVDVDAIISNPKKSILDGASAFWKNLRTFQKAPNANWMKGEVLALAQEMNIDLETPWMDLPQEFKTKVIYGTGTHTVSFSYANKNGRTGTITRPVEGVYHIIKRLLHSADIDIHTSNIEQFLISKTCTHCNGERLKIESRIVTVANTRFPEVINMSMLDLWNWVKSVPAILNETQASLAQVILQELYTKLADYIHMSLGYLTLDRAIPTLSGGEWQRLQLVSQLNSGLSNILYILDEPTAGLHPKDYDMLLLIIKKLKAMNNTVLLVEHSPFMMLAADYLIDIGPTAGNNGGYVVAQGTLQEILQKNNSETAMYLTGKKTLQIEKNVSLEDASWIEVQGIHGNNLKNIDIKFPLQAITCITGVSGSGKSSLVNLGILPAVQSLISTETQPHKMFKDIHGGEDITNIVHITQKPIGRSTRSTPATYTGIMDEIRLLFSKTPAARQLGYTQQKFSYNSKEGQCPSCHGYGYKSLDTAFMPSTKVRCPLCNGSKYHKHILEVTYQGLHIAQVLNMSILEALTFFKGHKKLTTMLSLLNEIGLGYITLGQSSLTLSGGEAQRIKLATHLYQNHTHTLYVLDEPTTGLHFCDIQNLLTILEKMTVDGNTVLLIEHNLDVIKTADWIIDLGPDGGDKGGSLLVQGTLSDVVNCKISHTGCLLKKNA